MLQVVELSELIRRRFGSTYSNSDLVGLKNIRSPSHTYSEGKRATGRQNRRVSFNSMVRETLIFELSASQIK